MSKKKKQQRAYYRGYKDALNDQREFLENLERQLLAVVLTIETSPRVSLENVCRQINDTRDDIHTFSRKLYGSPSSTPVRTILDLQDDDNISLGSDDIIDDAALRFFIKREISLKHDD